MSIVESLITVDKDLPVPVYQQIANGIINHIRRGTLKPESVLPGSRALAAALSVHRKTVVAAYDELYAQSWVDVYPRRGIFVAKNLPDVKPQPLPGNNGSYSFPAATFFEIKKAKMRMQFFCASATAKPGI